MALFPSLSIHQKQPHSKGGESDSTFAWEECQRSGGKKLEWKYRYGHFGKMKYLLIFLVFKRTNYLYINYMSRLEASVYL